MKTILVSGLALGAMTSVAFADEPSSKAMPAKAAPVPLTEVQMDAVTAGDTNVGVCVVCAQASIAAAIQALTLGSEAVAVTGGQTLRIGTGG